MPNTNTFTGMDGAITIAVDDADSVEGAAANTVAEAFALAPIGRATDVSIQVDSAMRPFHEIGQRYATELRPGNVNISGTIGRAHINGALLKLMLGDGAAGARPQSAFVSPSFNLSLVMENPGQPGDPQHADRARRQARWLELVDAGGRLRPRVGLVQGALDLHRGRRGCRMTALSADELLAGADANVPRRGAGSSARR